MDVNIRAYIPQDYNKIAELYKQNDLYGGQFDPDRDSESRLKRKVETDPEAILVAEKNGEIVGTVSLIEDGRAAFLFRFCVLDKDNKASELLLSRAAEILKSRGHQQVLVYSPVGNGKLNSRYKELGFTKGTDFTCFYRKI